MRIVRSLLAMGYRMTSKHAINLTALGHCAAILTIAIWGTTFISTKVLLTCMSPITILVCRFVLGFIALTLVRPKRLTHLPIKQELILAAAGATGVFGYYLLENIALTYTMASNVGVIAAVAPFFVALLACVVLKAEQPYVRYFVGFVVAMVGICLISFNGQAFSFNPLGDALAFVAAFVWAVYSILIKQISTWGYDVILTTRRIFFYGLVIMLPCAIPLGFEFDSSLLIQPLVVGNLLFLGLGASVLCFVTWNFAVTTIGAVKTSAYIYMSPVITVLTAVIVLAEPVTLISCVGVILTLSGLIISENVRASRKSIRKTSMST